MSGWAVMALALGLQSHPYTFTRDEREIIEKRDSKRERCKKEVREAYRRL
jgi:hypothetical protein